MHGFVAYHYLDEPFDDIDNQNKYLLHNYNNSPYAVFSFTFNDVNYYSKFCKHIPFIDGSVDMDAQLFSSYNQQLFTSIFNIINKYKQWPLSIYPVFNYSDFVYSFFKYHVEQFPSVFEPVKTKIKSMMWRFMPQLKFFRLHIPDLKHHVENVKKRLEYIKCCTKMMSSIIRCYIVDLERRVICWIERLTITIDLNSNVCNNNRTELYMSLKLCKDKLISCLRCKAKKMDLFQSNTESLSSIISLLDEICSSIKIDMSDPNKTSINIVSSESIKPEMDDFRSCVNKCVPVLRNIICMIYAMLGVRWMDNLNTAICVASTFTSLVRSRMADLEFSILVIIRSIGEGQTVGVQRATALFRCKIPSLSNIECLLKGLICRVNEQKSHVKEIKRHIQGKISIIEPRIKVAEGIKSELDEMESSINMVNFFKCSNQSITQNIIDLTKRLSGIGKQISNDGMIKSVLQSQGLRNQEKEQYGGVWAVMTHMFMMEHRLLTSVLYEYSGVRPEIEKILENTNCYCLLCVRVEKCGRYADHRPLSYIKRSDSNMKYDGLNIKNPIENEDNHICICLIVAYRLYPRLDKCMSYCLDILISLLCSHNRHFGSNNRMYYSDPRLSSLMFLIVRDIDKIFYLMEKKYLRETHVSEIGAFKCFCKYPDDNDYTYILTSMLCLSRIMEEIYNSKVDSLRITIMNLSNLNQQLGSLIDKVKTEPIPNKCRPGKLEQTETKSPALKKIMVLYQKLSVIYPQNVDLFKSKTVYFLIALQYPLLSISIIPSTVSSLIPFNLNGLTMLFFSDVKFRLLFGGDGQSKYFYQFYSTLSFELINSNCLSNKTTKYIKQVNILISNAYISTISDISQESCRNTSSPLEKCVNWKIITKCMCLLYHMCNNGSKHLSNKVVLDFIEHSEDCKKEKKILYYLTRRTISYPESMCKHSRTNRIVDSTNEKRNKVFEGASDNHYSYNDAYRINTSRAHGSLKYIIIKIVLILIIVVMTIFHRRYELISRHKKVNCSILQCFQPGFQMESNINPIPK